MYYDLLIGVTSFFRDEAAFESLAELAIPDLIDRVDEKEQIRAWVAACATGEEAYSLAILLHEAFESRQLTPQFKIFATDVHQKSLEHASAGFYPEESLKNVSLERREKFFDKREGGYQVRSELRQFIVFARHNVTTEAPFTRMDLITCRNLLIYFQPITQKKVLTLFHFGMKQGGVLFLGPSETAEALQGEFAHVDIKWKIYRKRRDVRLNTGDGRLLSGPGIVSTR